MRPLAIVRADASTIFIALIVLDPAHHVRRMVSSVRTTQQHWHINITGNGAINLSRNSINVFGTVRMC